MKSVEIISVPVSDPQRSKEFYLKIGLNLIIEAPMGPDQTWIQLGFPDGGASITLVNWFPKMTPGALQGTVILCDDIAQTIATLNEKGVETGKIDDTPWGKFATLNDPDGNSWSLHQA